MDIPIDQNGSSDTEFDIRSEAWGDPEPYWDPADRNMHRVGVVDVGSNSVRLVVFDGAVRSPAYFYNEKILCGLGASLVSTGKLNSAGKRRALAAIKRFVLVAQGINVSALIGIATAAVREASDGREFCEQIEQETGLNLEIASGEEEARLAAQGVVFGWPDASGLVCDIGGSSMELAEVENRIIGRCATSQLGPLSLNKFAYDKTAVGNRIREVLANLRDQMANDYRTLFLVGGSWRTIARLNMERTEYPLKVLNEYTISCDSALKTVEWIESKGIATLERVSGASTERIRLVPLAAKVLESIIHTFQPGEITVSAHGIREGILYDRMLERTRLRDPLIEACVHAERTSARLPGFGEKLYEFVRPLFKLATPGQLRLIRAACLLHDVTWRAHPDYRAEISFDNATRSNLGGLDHRGRIFLALALFHRYKNAHSGSGIEQLTELLPKSERQTAETVGKAMRFGAMFSVAAPERIGRLKFRSKKNMLILVLPESFKDIFGEVVEARFNSLATAMNCQPEVKIE